MPASAIRRQAAPNSGTPVRTSACAQCTHSSTTHRLDDRDVGSPRNKLGKMRAAPVLEDPPACASAPSRPFQRRDEVGDRDPETPPATRRALVAGRSRSRCGRFPVATTALIALSSPTTRWYCERTVLNSARCNEAEMVASLSFSAAPSSSRAAMLHPAGGELDPPAGERSHERSISRCRRSQMLGERDASRAQAGEDEASIARQARALRVSPCRSCRRPRSRRGRGRRAARGDVVVQP